MRFNTTRQLGAALGIAVLSALSATTTGSLLPDDDGHFETALTGGYATAYLWAAGLLLIAALIAAATVTSRERHHDAKPAA